MNTRLETAAITLDFVTLDHYALVAVVGGDGGDDYNQYKQRLGENWNQLTKYYNQTIDHNLRNGNWDPVKWADGIGGQAYTAGKLIADAIPEWVPVIGRSLEKKKG